MFPIDTQPFPPAFPVQPYFPPVTVAPPIASIVPFVNMFLPNIFIEPPPEDPPGPKYPYPPLEPFEVIV